MYFLSYIFRLIALIMIGQRRGDIKVLEKDRGAGSAKYRTKRQSNSGCRKHTSTICQNTNHQTIGADHPT